LPASLRSGLAGRSPLISGAQQCRVLALLGPRAHARSRSDTPMHSLSQQQASPVPIMQKKFSRDTGQQGYPRSVISTDDSAIRWRVRD
jgi:hypothetical protein